MHYGSLALLNTTRLFYLGDGNRQLISLIETHEDVIDIDTTTPFRFTIRQLNFSEIQYSGFKFVGSGFNMELKRIKLGALMSEFFIPTGAFAVI